MAFSQSEESSILQDELTCPVCLDLYRNPYLLPCGHNFCKNCLDHLKQQAERGRFRCPECRNSHKNGMNFQKNFKLANISDDYRRQRRAATAAAPGSKSKELLSSSLAVQQARSFIAVPCDYCSSVATEASGTSATRDECPAASVSKVDEDKERASACAPAAGLRYAVKTCLKCEVSMCQEHVKPHLELSVFREHPLTEPVNDLGKRKCPDHEEMYRYYCMDDKVCMCNACTIEGGHSGHTIKTLRNTMKDLKGTMEKQLYKAERKYSMAEKKFQEQKEKERQNKKCLDDCEEGLNRLGEEIKAKVLCFITRLQAHTRTHCDNNEQAIQKNISRICQDRARLQEVRCGLESLMQENDPFRFIEAHKTTGKQCRKQLRKNMFYPEYIDTKMEVLGAMMEMEMRTLLEEELPSHIIAAISAMCHFSDVEEEEQVENEEETVEEDDDEEDDDDDDDDDDDEDEDNEDDDDSSDEMRSDGEEEDEEDEGPDLSDLVDDLFSPEEEVEEEEEDDEEEDDGEEGDFVRAEDLTHVYI